MEAASRMLATGSTLPGGGSLKGAIAAGHGKAIAWEKYRLSDDRRLLFGDTPYEYPQVDLPTTLRNAFGPHYFGVASAESPMVAAVALAASSGLYLEGEALRRDGTGGGELLTAPIGHRSRFRVPFEPEVAVAFAATATRSRITELPRLILPRLPSAPLAARWQLVLRRPVHLRRLSDGSSFEADTIYVAQDPAAAANGRSDPFHLLVPAADQPGTDQMSIGGIDYYFNRRPSVPLVFDEVEVVR